MTMSSTIALYTPEYYEANESAILANSRCGNPVKLIQLDNYTYYSVKACEYDNDLRQYNPTTQIQDLTDLRDGVYKRYAMTVADFHDMTLSQKTAGDSQDHVHFERFEDPTFGGRWRLILSNRDSVDAFSIKVYDKAGNYLYTPGAFIDQGDDTWMVESNYVQYDGGWVQLDFILGSASITEVYSIAPEVYIVDWDIAYYTEG